MGHNSAMDTVRNWHPKCIHLSWRSKMKRMAIWLAIFGLGSGILVSQSMNLKIGLFAPRMQSDLWEINLDNLAFSQSDMMNAYYGAEYEVYLNRYSSFSLEIGSYSKTVFTQYRDYTFDNGDPILQTISLRITPMEVNFKAYPMGHRTMVFPFFGVGAGVYAWTYQQSGDFINFEDGSVNPGSAETRSFTVGFNGRLGLVFRFYPRLAVALEGKYQYLKGRLSGFFQDFDLLDLGGFSADISLNIYFR